HRNCHIPPDVVLLDGHHHCVVLVDHHHHRRRRRLPLRHRFGRRIHLGRHFHCFRWFVGHRLGDGAGRDHRLWGVVARTLPPLPACCYRPRPVAVGFPTPS